MPLGKSGFVHDSLESTGRRDRMVNTRFTAMDDHETRAVTAKHPVYNLHRQLRTTPMSISSD